MRTPRSVRKIIRKKKLVDKGLIHCTYCHVHKGENRDPTKGHGHKRNKTKRGGKRDV